MGYTLLLVSPIALAAASIPAGYSRSAASRLDDRATAPAAPVISLSIEPAGGSSVPGAGLETPPVILPGYLLPDDGSEEPAHAGS